MKKIVVGVLVAVVFCATSFGAWYFVAGRYTEVPTLAGLSQSSAVTKAKSAYVQPKILSVYSETIKASIVFSAKPIAGTKVLKNSSVTLTVSKGPKPRIVPNLAGKPLDSATAQLARIGLSIEVSSQIYASKPLNTVLSSSPLPGTSVKRGSAVKVTLSKGLEPRPSVVVSSPPFSGGITVYPYNPCAAGCIPRLN